MTNGSTPTSTRTLHAKYMENIMKFPNVCVFFITRKRFVMIKWTETS